MDGAFGAGTAVHFSPKDLGLNVGFFGLFSDSPRLDFRTVFGQSETKFLGRTIITTFHCYHSNITKMQLSSVWLLGKMEKLFPPLS